MTPRQEIDEELKQKKLPRLSGNIYAIGRNYREHALELNNPIPEQPVVFLKAPSSLRTLSHGALAFPEETFHHEVEVVLLIGGTKHKLAAEVPVVGLTLGLDLTRRALQNELKSKGLPWTLAKSFQGSAVLGPWTPVRDDLINEPIDLKLAINGVTRQKGNTKDLLFNFSQLLSFLSQAQPLEDGDLVFTGTPSGVGPIRVGDRIHLQSQKLELDAQGVL